MSEKSICRSGVGFALFAIYAAGAGVAVLLAQSLLARRALETLGLAGTVAVRSAAVVGLDALALFIPGLPSLLLVRSTQTVLSSSLFRSGYELLFTPVPPKPKRPTKTLVDVGFDERRSGQTGSTTAYGKLAKLTARRSTHAPRKPRPQVKSRSRISRA